MLSKMNKHIYKWALILKINMSGSSNGPPLANCRIFTSSSPLPWFEASPVSHLLRSNRNLELLHRLSNRMLTNFRKQRLVSSRPRAHRGSFSTVPHLPSGNAATLWQKIPCQYCLHLLPRPFWLKMVNNPQHVTLIFECCWKQCSSKS